MATIGHIKETRIVDGQIVCDVETGNGQTVTAVLFADAGSEYHPLPGDRVVFEKAGQDIVIKAVLSEDASTSGGQGLIFSRNAAGEVVASILLGSDGRVTISPSTDVRVGNGQSPVALANNVDALWNALWGVFNGWTPVYESALKTGFLAAFQPPGPQSVASNNLRAD